MKIVALTYALGKYVGGTLKISDNKTHRIKTFEKRIIPNWSHSKGLVLITADGQEIIVGDTLSQGVEHEGKLHIDDDKFVLEPKH